MEDELILVNEHDEPVGVMSKLLAHQLGYLHRAFSVFIFNEQNELLIQQRALHKYHSAGQWANSCCSHPKPNEDTQKAAERRLQEELGFVTPLTYVGSLIYKADVQGGLIEHEYDHIFIGYYNQYIQPNRDEVSSIRWVSLPQLKQEIVLTPEIFTPWFKKILEEFPLLYILNK
ncbi:isopentenyl-diphosphate Delta-isomerase [Providencia rettgeri]|uniref:isopentenyl-diphosphate Delta-isomerase n=1 Tax=Providencia sp. PROV146 TaxID=2949856 RepID=UPI00234B5C44|nr:isopentenyl-diphosphate Delta-isomerase [Providencia sp. PROV146]